MKKGMLLFCPQLELLLLLLADVKKVHWFGKLTLSLIVFTAQYYKIAAFDRKNRKAHFFFRPLVRSLCRVIIDLVIRVTRSFSCQ